MGSSPAGPAQTLYEVGGVNAKTRGEERGSRSSRDSGWLGKVSEIGEKKHF